MSVAVTVDLDPTMVESTVKELDPNTQVTISEQVREEDSKNQTAGGVPGVEANLPENAAAARQGNTERSTSELSSNYDYTTTQRRTVQRAGKIDRVNVAVMVDEARLSELVAAAGDGADITAVKSQIDAAVRVAMGFDEERGDSIAVTFMPFSDPRWMPVRLVGSLESDGSAPMPSRWSLWSSSSPSSSFPPCAPSRRHQGRPVRRVVLAM